MNPLEPYFSTSFVGDLSYQPPSSEMAGLAHTMVTGRKTWKTFKAKNNEAVWPVHIEAALFDALEKYRPASSGDPKLLRRFPKRNRFISDHIFKITGKERTAKQVGSRLQQLKDTCQEEKVLKLLSRREFPPLSDDAPLPSDSSDFSTSPSTPTLSPPSSTSGSPATSPTDSDFPDDFSEKTSLTAALSPPVVYVEVLSPPSLCEPSLDIESLPAEPVNLLTLNLPADDTCPIPSLTPEQHHVRLAQSTVLIPSITFTSTQPISGYYLSMYFVFLGDYLVHSEVTDLVPYSDSYHLGTVYSTRLIPQYWETLVGIHDLSPYTVAQDIIKIASIETNEIIQNAVLLSLAYKFKSPIKDLKPPMAGDYSLTTGLLVSGTANLDPNTPLYAPSPVPLLIDAANTLLACEHGWFGRYQPALLAPQSSEPASDFINFNNFRHSPGYCKIEQPNISPYLNTGPVQWPYALGPDTVTIVG